MGRGLVGGVCWVQEAKASQSQAVAARQPLSATPAPPPQDLGKEENKDVGAINQLANKKV